MDWNQLPLQDLDSAMQMVEGARAAMNARGLTLCDPPAAPTICCGRGCYECVWKDYYAALNVWRGEARRALANATSSGEAPIHAVQAGTD